MVVASFMAFSETETRVLVTPGCHYHAISSLFTIFLQFQPHALRAIITRQLTQR